jgi:hypothetical protein
VERARGNANATLGVLWRAGCEQGEGQGGTYGRFSRQATVGRAGQWRVGPVGAGASVGFSPKPQLNGGCPGHAGERGRGQGEV